MHAHGRMTCMYVSTFLHQVERAFDLAKAEHEQDRLQRERAQEAALKAAIEKREATLALAKVRLFGLA